MRFRYVNDISETIVMQRKDGVVAVTCVTTTTPEEGRVFSRRG